MLRGDFGVTYTISKNTPISQLIQSRRALPSVRMGGMPVTLGDREPLLASLLASSGDSILGHSGYHHLGHRRVSPFT